MFQKFHVLFINNGVLQKYLWIVCITMIQNDLMNSNSVFWKKLTGVSYIIKSWNHGTWLTCCVRNCPPLLRKQNIIVNYVTDFCEIPSFAWSCANSRTNNRLRYTLGSVTTFTILLLANVLFVISWRQFRIPK